jgi:plastocyanin
VRIRTLLAPAGLGIVALLAALAAAPSAVGGASSVTVGDNFFSPSTSNVNQGTTVTWSFQGVRDHTSTSNQGFWNSGAKSSGSSFSRGMPSAGRFPYHCSFHAEMTGRVVVPLKVTGGSAGSGWTLRWSASPAGSNRAFDVQFRRQGTTTWRSFRTNTTAATGLFNPSQSGTYQLRARTTNTGASPDKESGWSPVISRQIS